MGYYLLFLRYMQIEVYFILSTGVHDYIHIYYINIRNVTVYGGERVYKALKSITINMY